MAPITAVTGVQCDPAGMDFWPLGLIGCAHNMLQACRTQVKVRQTRPPPVCEQALQLGTGAM